MTQIIAFAGKKQSGKNTACNGLYAMKMMELGICNSARLNDKGLIEVSDIFGENKNRGDFFELTLENVNLPALENQELAPHVRIYAFADILKEFCIAVFGFPYEKVYGDDKDKNTETYLKWEDMPGVTTEPVPKKWQKHLTYHEPGKMTIREVLQFFGTEICRKMYSNIWVDSLIRRINIDGPELALVCDARFSNEILSIKESGGFVIGLKRNYDVESLHASEAAPLELCNIIIDNTNLDIVETSQTIYEEVKHLSGVPQLV